MPYSPLFAGEQGGWQHKLASEQSFITVESQVVLGMAQKQKYVKGLNPSNLIKEIIVDSGNLDP